MAVEHQRERGGMGNRADDLACRKGRSGCNLGTRSIVAYRLNLAQ